MALHTSACNCEGCKERGMGYPAFCDEGDVAIIQLSPNPQFIPGNYDPSTFGRASARALRRGYGQAFVPGVVKPPMPASAFDEEGPVQPIATVPGLPTNADQAIALLTASGQAPSPTTGISPTLSLSQAQNVAANAGYNLNADGSIALPSSTPNPAQFSPLEIGLAGLAVLLLLK